MTALLALLCVLQDAGPWTIRVLVVNYFPTQDKKSLDASITGMGGSLEDVRKRCAQYSKEVVEALEEGSRFRAYKNKDAKPSLKYEIVDTIEFLEALPKSAKKYKEGFLPDYNAIMRRIDVKTWVEKKGVREIWIWAYHTKDSELWESNMSSPHGDISNSDRDPNDLPILDRTYTVYHYNYAREVSMAVHDHLHQIEFLMRDLGGELWRIFEGKPGAWRCGNCHFPPNGRHDYDWYNKESVESDIEDWKPEGYGEKKQINSDTWGNSDMKWYIYWMQSIPGRDNGLTYKGKKLTNWWIFVGDYDRVRKDKIGLTE